VIELIKETIPDLRFPEFNKSEKSNFYKKYSFNKLFIFSSGKNIKQNEASPNFEIPCVRYGELYHMYGEVINKIYNKTNLNKSELLFSKGDEILLPSAGEDPIDIGSASALTVKNVAIGRTINILRPLIENIYYQIYVSYYINQKLKKRISTLAKGSSISNVYNSDLKKLEIYMPDIEEQQKVSSFLSTVDLKIEKLTRKKELLEEYKKGVMQKLFNQEIRFKDNDGNDYPEWEILNLGSIGEFKTSSVDKKIVEGEKLVHLVNYMNVYKHEKIESQSVEGLMTVSANERQLITSDLRVGDILFTPSSETPDDIGHSIVIQEDLKNTLYSYHLIRFRPKIKLDILYSHYFCNNKDVLRQITRVATGSTRFTVSVGEFSKIIVNIPSRPEQKKIAIMLSTLDDKIKYLSTQISTTKKFKKGLLQQMFV